MKSLSKLVTVTASVNILNSSGNTAATIDPNTTLSNMTVTSADDSQKTIAFMSEIIRQVDSYRAELGAVQNRMESTISNQENVVETANMTQQSIIQQASTTILTQANQKTQIAMNLLQG